MPVEGEKTCSKFANGQDIDYSGGKWPQGFVCPFTWAIFDNIQTCLYSRFQVSLYRTIGPHVYFFFSAGNTMTEHRSDPKVSSVVVDFQSTDIVGESTLEALIKLHGNQHDVWLFAKFQPLLWFSDITPA